MYETTFENYVKVLKMLRDDLDIHERETDSIFAKVGNENFKTEL